MSTVCISGLGAVSPAGWGVAALVDALRRNAQIPTSTIPKPGGMRHLTARLVPPPSGRPGFLSHPRLRRTSPITHHAAAAALEALGLSWNFPNAGGAAVPGGGKLGVVCCFQSGCVQYSSRFFEEALKDPATASPLAFPETVFAAPTSHIATLLGGAECVTSLIGDPASFLQGLAIGADWLLQGRVDQCLVVGAEESHWITADALWHFQRQAVFSSGAGALCLTLTRDQSLGVELEAITDAHTFKIGSGRARAASAMRAQLPDGSPAELLCDGLDSSPRTDAAEREVWKDWTGERLSPKRVLGEGFMASAAWQCVAACEAVAARNIPAAMVSLVGCNQQAIGARFVRHSRT